MNPSKILSKIEVKFRGKRIHQEFDAEFNLYRNISKTLFDMIKNVTVMIPQGLVMVPADKELKIKEAIKCHYRILFHIDYRIMQESVC